MPLQCEMLAHRGVGQFLRTITDVQQITNADLKLLGALPTLYDSRTTHSRDVLLDVADRYDMPVLAPPIPRTVRFAEASASGASVLASRKNKGAYAYRELADALLKHWNRQGAGDVRAGGLSGQAPRVRRRAARAPSSPPPPAPPRIAGRALQRDVSFTRAGDRVEDVDAVGDGDDQPPGHHRGGTHRTCGPDGATVYR